MARLEILDRERDPDEPGALTLLCERQKLEVPAVARMVYRFEHPEIEPLRSIDFDIADKLLCGADLHDMWWGELRDYYYGVNLVPHEHCPDAPTPERPFDCGHERTPENSTPCGSKNGLRYYRCKQCANAARRHRRKNECRNGHEFTPDNTMHRPDGRRECLTCKREANNASYARRQLVAA